jgi:2-polyprenyl-6-hydroxyphenyl methylase/3-demethylubiquinone-9 3-methyltransferase
MAALPNIDPDEIEKFEAQSPLWWEKNGKFRGLHDINPLRLQYIESRSSLAGKKVVDVGCGGGILAEGMAALGAQVTGIDFGEAPLAAARRHMRTSGLQIVYRKSTAEELAAAEPEAYDIVTCMELLEHVPQPASVIAACHRLVKPAGDVYFATLNRTWKAFILAIIAAEYLLGVVKRGTHSYRRLLKPEEIDAWARQAGLVRQDTTGLHYNPVLGRRWLGGNTDVNYLMHFRKNTDGTF